MKKLTIYLEDYEWDRISEAATMNAMTFTEFGRKALLQKADEEKEVSTTDRLRTGFEDKGDYFTGVSVYYMSLLKTAKVRGSMGYHSVGYWFAKYVHILDPGIFSTHHWMARVGEFVNLCSDTDRDKKGFHWLMRYFPDLAKMIPSQKRDSFFAGVLECFEKEENEVKEPVE